MKYVILLTMLAVMDIAITHFGFIVGARELNPLMEHPINTWWGMSLKVVLTFVVAWSLVYKEILFSNCVELIHIENVKKRLVFSLKIIRITKATAIIMMTAVVLWNVGVVVYLVTL